MPTEIVAAVVEQLDGPFFIVPLELDDPGPGEVLVKLTATGICHTDGLARHGDLPFPLAGVLGHEGAGIVAAAGPGVTDFAAGTGSSSAGRTAGPAGTASQESTATACGSVRR